MATDNAESNAAPAAKAGGRGGSKKRLLLAILACAGLAGGGYVLGGRSAAAGESAPPTASAPEGEDGHHDADGDDATAEGECAPLEEEVALGHVIDLPSMNVNLADGHYLRLAISLGLSEEVKVEKPEEFPTAVAKDIVVSTLSGATMATLATTAGREDVKAQLTELIVEAYEGEVVSVFLTEFVMQ